MIIGKVGGWRRAWVGFVDWCGLRAYDTENHCCRQTIRVLLNPTSGTAGRSASVATWRGERQGALEKWRMSLLDVRGQFLETNSPDEKQPCS